MGSQNFSPARRRFVAFSLKKECQYQAAEKGFKSEKMRF